MGEEFTLAQEYNQQGVILYGKDKYTEALSYFEKAIAEDPYYTDSYINCAQVYIMMDQFEDALKSLDKVLMIDKKNGLAYFHKGNVELLKGDSDAARESYNKAVSLGYDNLQIYINLASDAEDRADFDTAISYYNKVIAIDRYNAYAKVRKMQILVDMKRLPEALTLCDSLIESNPDVFEGYHYKFAILCELEKYDEAEKVLERALTLFPDDEAFFYDKARLCHAQGRLEDALQIIDEKLEFNDNNRTALVTFKAEVLLALEKTEEALDILLEEYPKSHDGEIAFLLNSIYIATKKYEEVLRYSQQIIDNGEIGNYYYAALYYHAVALSKLGRKQEADAEFENAQKFFRAACARQPGQLQLYFYRAMCYSELGRNDKAIEMTDYLLNVDENLHEARLIRMKAYQEMGREADAARERSILEAKKPEILKMMEE